MQTGDPQPGINIKPKLGVTPIGHSSILNINQSPHWGHCTHYIQGVNLHTTLDPKSSTLINMEGREPNPTLSSHSQAEVLLTTN